MRNSLLIPFLACAVMSAQQLDRDAKWAEDVDYLAASIQAIHPDPAFKVTRQAFQEAATTLKTSIPRLSDAEVIAGMARLAAMLGDGHTNLNPLQSAAGLRQYAIRVKWFSDGLFVTAVGPTTKSFMGKKVVSIGGTAIESTFDKLKPYISYENENWARDVSQNMLVSPDMLAATGIISAVGASTWELEDAAGNRESIELQPGGGVTIDGPHLSQPGNPVYRRNPTLPYWYTSIEGQGILYLKYLRCEESPALPMEQFANDFVQQLKSKPTTRVVFDLRDNTGGNTRWLNYLLDCLLDAYGRNEISIPPEGFYALVGRRTFSSAAIHAFRLRQLGFVMVGEPTGGNPSSFGEVKSFVLPNSRLSLSCSSRKIEVPDSPFNEPVQVHVPATFSSADFFADLDPILEAARTIPFPQA